MNEHETTNPIAPYLCLKTGSEVEYIELDSSSNALVGAGSHCKIQLEGENIQSLHCILAMKAEGWLEVRDWNTGSTFLNGEAISEPTVMNEGDCLKIGEYEISIVLASEGVSEGQRSTSDISQDEATDVSLSDKQKHQDFWSQAERPMESESELDADAESKEDLAIAVEPIVSELPVEIDLVAGETEMHSEEATRQPKQSSSQEFVYDIDADFDDEAFEPSLGFAAPTFAEDTSMDANEVQSLRMQVEQLRFELAQRNTSSELISDELSRDQTVRLVYRLEELLVELKRSDVRIRDMEELLRAADQATSDEQEERKQIEEWISELENRVNQREEETEAEIQQLKKLLMEAREAQQKSNECLKSVVETRANGGEALTTELANKLNKQIGSLQQQLQTSQGEATSLGKQLEERFASASSESQVRESEQKLAGMQLEAARERAEISRQRVELKRLKADLEEQLSGPREANVADTRIRAMREHLKELHEKEEKEKAEKLENGGGGLGNRIASLLHRVTSN